MQRVLTAYPVSKNNFRAKRSQKTKNGENREPSSKCESLGSEKDTRAGVQYMKIGVLKLVEIHG